MKKFFKKFFKALGVAVLALLVVWLVCFILPRPQNFPLVREALRQAKREDLIGTGRNCIVPPEGVKTAAEYAQIRREKKEREQRRNERNAKPVKGKPAAPSARKPQSKTTRPAERPKGKRP